MSLTDGIVGVAMLFTVGVVEGVDLRIELDCASYPLAYNATTKIFTCGRLTMDVSGCKPTSVSNVETGNANIVCSETGQFKLTCPGGFRKLANDEVGNIVYACDDSALSPPARVRIITK